MYLLLYMYYTVQLELCFMKFKFALYSVVNCMTCMLQYHSPHTATIRSLTKFCDL